MSMYNSIVSCPPVFLYVHSSGFAYPRFPLVICPYITPCFMSFSVSLRAQLWFCIPKISSGYMSMYNSIVSCPPVFLYVHSSGFAYPRFPLVICPYITPCFMSFSVSLRAQLWFCIHRFPLVICPCITPCFMSFSVSLRAQLWFCIPKVSSGYMSIYNSMFHVLQCFSTCTAMVLHTQDFLWLYVDI